MEAVKLWWCCVFAGWVVLGVVCEIAYRRVGK
jgi:hypothetical protein